MHRSLLVAQSRTILNAVVNRKHEQFNPRNSADTILLSEAQVAWGNAPVSMYFPLNSVRFNFKDGEDATVY